VVTDYRGDVYEHIEYTPYGELWVEHAPNVEATPFRFTGKERDSETGLYYYGARYLNPQTGMWLSTDPAMGEYIPMAPISDQARRYNKNLPGMGGVFNTVNLHTYHYAGTNPVKYTDPSGMNLEYDGDTIRCELSRDDLDKARQALDTLDTINGGNPYKRVIATDKVTGTSVEFYSTSAIHEMSKNMADEFDYSSPEAFLASLGFGSAALGIISDVIGSEALGTAGNIIGLLPAGVETANHIKNWTNYSTSEKILAGIDTVVNLGGFFGGLPGAGISIVYNATKSGAPYVYQGIRAMNQDFLKPVYNYFDIMGYPQEFYNILRKF
jgi:RHS repeat-associated protein